jgi:hypothetical protein
MIDDNARVLAAEAGAVIGLRRHEEKEGILIVTGEFVLSQTEVSFAVAIDEDELPQLGDKIMIMIAREDENDAAG